MNRLLALAVLASLGTGCISSDTCDVRTVGFTWDNFLRADGTPSASCFTASLGRDPVARTIDVWLDGYYQGTVNCTDRALYVDGVPPGTHDLTVEARDAGHVIMLRDELTFHAPSTCEDLIVDSTPAEGYLSVGYDFYAGGSIAATNACVPGSTLAFSITDTIPNPPEAATSTTACTILRSFLLPLPSGAFNFDWMEEQLGDTVESSACSASQYTPSKSFTIGRAQTTQLAVAMQKSNPPACY